jgi:hypothetical protein
MPVIITACSSRKSVKPVRMLRAATIPKGSFREVGSCWIDRVRTSAKLVSAGELYQGRSFFESCAAADALGCDLYIVSAGLGLVARETLIPAYSITVANGSPDDIRHRVSDVANGLASRWWNLVSRRSPLGTGIAELVRETSGLVLIALPSGYLEMVADDLAELHGRSIRRLRIFTLALPEAFPGKLRRAVMPYDDRLDGPDSERPGTRSDFAPRALRHFADRVLSKFPEGDLDAHRRAVNSTLAGWRRPKTPVRSRRTDAEMKALIRANWKAAGGRSGRMLRVLRDDLEIACEQSRFAKLFTEVSARREGGR